MDPVGGAAALRGGAGEVSRGISCGDADAGLQGRAAGLAAGLQEAASASRHEALPVCGLIWCCQASLDGIVGGGLDLQHLTCNRVTRADRGCSSKGRLSNHNQSFGCGCQVDMPT